MLHSLPFAGYPTIHHRIPLSLLLVAARVLYPSLFFITVTELELLEPLKSNWPVAVHEKLALVGPLLME
jgi:hypothetical protein